MMYIPPERLEKLKDQFDLYNYLLARGFKFLPKDSVKNSGALDGYEYRIMKLSFGRGSSITLTLSMLSSGRFVYANLHDDKDKGSCLDYFMNHENQSFGEALVTISSSAPKEVIATYKRNKPKPQVEEPYLTITSTEVFRFDKYFEERGILKTILKNPFIKQSLSKVNYITKDNRDRALYTHGFQLKDGKGVIKSYNLRGTMHPDGLFSGPREKALWYAHTQEYTTLVIGESAIDCISYYELKGNQLDYPMLISSEGRFSKNYADTLKIRVGEELSSLQVILINDNDLFGYFYDFSWIKYLFDLQFDVGLNKDKTTGESSISIKTDDVWFKHLLEIEEDDQVLKLTHLNDCQKLLNRITANMNVRMDKSKSRDWNEDLMKM